MTNDELSMLITEMTQKNFDANKEFIMKAIMDCVNEEEAKGNINMYSLFPKLLVLMSSVTMKLSTATTFSVLNAIGMFHPEDFEKVPPEKPLLYLVKE